MQIRMLIFCFVLIAACKSPAGHSATQTQAQDTGYTEMPQPNYKYTVELPALWTQVDSVMPGGLRVKLLYAPADQNPDRASVNILIAYMNEENLDDFTARNMKYLVSNRTGVTLLDQGSITTASGEGRWFRYTLENDNGKRDMLNYIIPLKGFAYMITCGVQEGTMKRNRSLFDKIAFSFKG